MRTHLYEGMFLVDNDSVRADFKRTKALITDFIAKYEGSVQTARRWDERRLAYPIEGRQRATFVLVYFEMGTGSVATLRRDLELSETILRYLIKRVEHVPASERSLHEAELAPDFAVPAPPDEDEIVPPEPEPEDEDARGGRRPARGEGRRDRPAPAQEGSADETESFEETEATAAAGVTESKEG